MEPPAVGMNEALGGILTYKLEGNGALNLDSVLDASLIRTGGRE